MTQACLVEAKSLARSIIRLWEVDSNVLEGHLARIAENRAEAVIAEPIERYSLAYRVLVH
jgi:hypothetical protein